MSSDLLTAEDLPRRVMYGRTIRERLIDRVLFEGVRYLSTAPTQIGSSECVIVRRHGPDIYVPTNQSAAFPVPRPLDIAGALLRDVNTPLDRRPGSSIHSAGTDPQPPPPRLA